MTTYYVYENENYLESEGVEDSASITAVDVPLDAPDEIRINREGEPIAILYSFLKLSLPEKYLLHLVVIDIYNEEHPDQQYEPKRDSHSL